MYLTTNEERDNISLEPIVTGKSCTSYLKKSYQVMSRYLVLHSFINE